MVLLLTQDVKVLRLLQRTSEYLWVLGHLPDQGPCRLIKGFGWMTSSRNTLHGSKQLPFHSDGAHCALGNIQSDRNGLILLHRSTSRYSLIMEIPMESSLDVVAWFLV